MGPFQDLAHIVRENEPLAPFTWFRIGGVAEFFAEPTNVDELAQLVRRCHQSDVPVRLIGGGSNILVRDEGVPGMVVHLSAAEFSRISVVGQVITAGGGAKLGHVISTSVREGLAGLEQLVGIPGTVGGALRGNAGTQNGDIGQWTQSVTLLTLEGQQVTRGREDLRFAYRASNLDDPVILSAEFALEAGDPQELTRRMQTLWILKKSTQPTGNQHTGCIFKDPSGLSAAGLIEQAGLKGTKVGEAEVSDQHANFIVAGPGASSSDVLRLIDLIQGRVAERLGVELEVEIQIW
ncbi:MAG: UDP-N-acetylmuramate dehydrogenase [Pirellulaceae bacterium]|nr:UDP-N-acetylmuramate dehydrogenase [Pirellulaceae bacterium]